jgi:hypothetical protein
MLVTVFSAKGSPGVTSSALALAAVWPRPVVLVEADPTGTDLVYRCRSAAGGPVAPAPNILGLASAVRGDRSAPIGGWTQPLANGVRLVPGVTTASQGRGLTGLWRAVAGALVSAEVDVIADVGRLAREDPTVPLVAEADVRVPVVSGSLESLMHAREQLLDMAGVLGGRTVPLLVGRARTAAADTADLDEVLAGAGVMAEPATHLPLDHPGLSALEDGARPTGRGRMSLLVRAARTVADRVTAVPVVGVR